MKKMFFTQNQKNESYNNNQSSFKYTIYNIKFQTEISLILFKMDSY